MNMHRMEGCADGQVTCARERQTSFLKLKRGNTDEKTIAYVLCLAMIFPLCGVTHAFEMGENAYTMPYEVGELLGETGF